MNFILGIIFSAVAFLVGAKVMSSVHIKSFGSAILIALVMALLNGTIGAVVKFLGTPINWLTLGLFNFLVTGALVLLASKLLGSFHVRNFWAALGLTLIVSVVNWFLLWVTGF